ncbi:hypothetical protein ACN9VA_03550 [Staphylococcus caprae]|uniref:hypothetical protein n=1 Tax=Staphylococcus TaxID=1279 RepID=UPI0007335ED8|nr:MULTISPECIES: hypothetical protein [Staphylococcus]MBU5271250.1 hypothetical protein [Staphylococcus caprae]MDK6297111.1 hypothetical protein [Staphylococcus caprae]MDK7233625.1 hypothetical protein [Staphylococcus caprae]PNM98173.1 hypothetical protein AL529_003995 [Staphylococcus capitis]
MNKQEIILDENELLDLINSKSIITRVGESKVTIRQSYVKPMVRTPIHHRYQITDTLDEREKFTSITDII